MSESNVKSVSIEQVAKNEFKANILYKNGEGLSETFDNFTDANKWINDQEGVISDVTADGSLPNQGSPASNVHDEDSAKPVDTETHGEPNQPTDQSNTEETAHSNNSHTDNERLKAEQDNNT